MSAEDEEFEDKCRRFAEAAPVLSPDTAKRIVALLKPRECMKTSSVTEDVS